VIKVVAIVKFYMNYCRLYIIILMVLGFSLATCILLLLAFYLIRNSNKQILAINQTLIHQKREIERNARKLEKANRLAEDVRAKLERMVSQKTEELKLATKELDHFLYRSSHDLRGPLSTLLGITNLARTTIKEDSSLHFLDKIELTVHKMEGMIKKLNQIHLINNFQSEYKVVDFESIIQRIYERYSLALNEGIHFDYSVESGGKIKSNSVMISMILDNLVENSIRFQLKHDQEGSYIKVRIQDSSGNLEIEVEDNGRGIPQENIDKIYSMYYRGDSSSDGNGLGLYLIKKATEKLGGTIDISSAIGKGTKFYLSIPPEEFHVDKMSQVRSA